MQAFRYSTVALFLIGSTAVAVAQTPNRLGTFRDWNAYTFNDGRGKVCYVFSQPKETQPKNVNRDPVFFMISNRPAESVENEASVIIGYPFRADSKVTVDVDGQQFQLFTKDDGAWVENAAEEAALVDAMRRGIKLVIKGVSARGTETVDTYSLSGVTAALESVAKECR